jgi:8-oxo-dGTP diphosphatase
MSFIRCACGRRHWGPYGAAGLLLVPEERDRVLLQLRSAKVLSPHTWALPGGALERGETPTQAAVREAHEEAGVVDVTPQREIPGLEHPQWRYTYVLATTPSLDLPAHSSWEAADHRWCALDDTPGLHPDLARDWPMLVAEIQAG